MIIWLIRRYIKKHLKIRIQWWPVSERIETELLLDDDVISSSFIHIDRIDD